MKCAIMASGSKGNSFVLSDKGVNILIDCGTSQRYIKTSLNSLGIEVDDLDSVLITHGHSDHIQAINLVKDLPVYSAFELNGIDSELIIHEEEFYIGHLSVIPLSLSHDAPMTTGFVISSEEEKLVYITDTGYVPERYMSLLSNADYYVIESNHDVDMLMKTNRPMSLKQRILGDYGHLSNEACAEFLYEAIGCKTRNILLAHISDQANSRKLCLNNALTALSDKQNDLHDELVISTTSPRKIILMGEWEKNIDIDFDRGRRLRDFVLKVNKD